MGQCELGCIYVAIEFTSPRGYRTSWALGAEAFHKCYIPAHTSKTSGKRTLDAVWDARQVITRDSVYISEKTY